MSLLGEGDCGLVVGSSRRLPQGHRSCEEMDFLRASGTHGHLWRKPEARRLQAKERIVQTPFLFCSVYTLPIASSVIKKLMIASCYSRKKKII